jgi:hypothetical protein
MEGEVGVAKVFNYRQTVLGTHTVQTVHVSRDTPHVDDNNCASTGADRGLKRRRINVTGMGVHIN